MSEDQISASGERAAISGYLPQFDEFAWFTYLNLINKELEWIRVADPQAEKLDDIQYSTHFEIHAYQVKWTIADERISFTDFKKLFPLIASSWKKLKVASTKNVIPHLLTNKPLSAHDSIQVNDVRLGTFQNFFDQVWSNLKTGQPYEKKWEPVVQELKQISLLDDINFDTFIKHFDFQPNYKKKNFTVGSSIGSKEEGDLIQLSRFILENVASPDRPVEFSKDKIIQELGWQDRFRTTFNHDFIIDKHKYQPLQSTIAELDLKINNLDKGYIFLVGGPGTGKSTLLTFWSKNRNERIIKYYAFDFKSPSSLYNYFARGEAATLFFDLVFQLKEAGIYKKNILPHKDITFLKNIFFEQLNEASIEFKATGRKTVLVIDGLDHVPREYKSASQNFLRELPIPNEIPPGILILLGSQTYELKDLPQEVRSEYKSNKKTISISALSKSETLGFIDANNIEPELTYENKMQVFEKSLGHPLYLSYLIERIRSSVKRSELIESFLPIDGDIENYYKKIWEPIQNDTKLKDLLGLISRINGTINPAFITEWGIEQGTLRDFKDKAKLLFNNEHDGLVFFHNSFKQFLLLNTAIDILSDEFDSKIEISFHARLSEFYKLTKVEPKWKRNHHLFQSKQFDVFLDEISPASFTSQFLDFRPAAEIIRDAKLGIEIARQIGDVHVLLKYLFALSEIDNRLFHVDPAAFTEQLLALNKSSIAKNYLRSDNTLLCNISYALKACKLFIKFGDLVEANILFNLAYPDVIHDTSINIKNSHRGDETKQTLSNWVAVAVHFEEVNKIILKINNISISNDDPELKNNESDLRLTLLAELAFTLINDNKWNDLEKVINEFNLNEFQSKNFLFQVLNEAIEACLEIRDNNHANEYLTILLKNYLKDSTKPIGKIFIADLIYKVTGNIEASYDWVKDIPQPSLVGEDRLGYNDTLNPFYPLIKLNKLLNLRGKGVPITKAIPSAVLGTDDEIMVGFERNLCLIAQILSEGLLHTTSDILISKRVIPIIRFYYQDVSFRNKYWYNLTERREAYFDLLIFAVSKLGEDDFKTFAALLFEEVLINKKYWPATLQRKIIKSFIENGLEHEQAIIQLQNIEPFMLDDHDVSGRTTQCVAHSDVWILLQDFRKAESWLKQAIKESIGVGYKKDYQFSTWIEWLRKINKIEPEKAASRIMWFLSHLNHIKEITEGAAYWEASDGLLNATFEWNFDAGFQQLQWQLNGGLADFVDTLDTFLEFYLEKVTKKKEYEPILRLYCEISLYISKSAHTRLLQKVLSVGYSLFGNNFCKKYLSEIIAAINIKSLEEHRHYLLLTVKTFLESLNISARVGSPLFDVPEQKRSETSSTYNNSLTLKNKEYFPEEKVLKLTIDYKSLKYFLEEENPHSYFRWNEVFDKSMNFLTISEIGEVAKIIRSNSRAADLNAKLSEGASNKGDKKLALELALYSLELSSASGWIKYYDGGTRIQAFEALKRIDSKKYSHEAFDAFAYDIISGNYSATYAQHLKDIIPVITQNCPVQTLWPEIFDHLQSLMSNSIPKSNLPPLIANKESISKTLSGYLFYLSQNPTRIIREGAIKLLALNIHNGDHHTIEQLLKSDLNDSSELETINDVLMYLLQIKSTKLIKFKKIIMVLATSRNYYLRKNGCSLLSFLKERIPEQKKIQLPEIYNIQIQNSVKIHPKPEENIDIEFPAINLNDPEDVIRPFGKLIDILSKESGINRMTLLYRVYSIMKEISDPNEWTYLFEKKLRSHLSDIYLEYPFPRPRVIAARNAIMNVVTELLDSGAIDDDVYIEKIFITFDYAVSTFQQVSKPVFIQTITDTDYGTVKSDWVQRIDSCERLSEGLVSYSKDMKVIGEHTELQCLDWRVPTEVYSSQLSISGKINKDDGFIFGSAFNVLTENYYDFDWNNSSTIIIRDHRFEQFDTKSKWLALNPKIARNLNWVPAPNKMFGWKDKRGRMMAESVYWANGNLGIQPRKNSETGEGWLVLASSLGLVQIRKLCPKLFIQKTVSRSHNSDQKSIERTVPLI